MHVPEEPPKDGPSAGITMAIAYSYQNKPIKNIAMTGEPLTYQVLAIGGLREKTVAAIRNQIKQIIIPKSNLRR